MEIRDNFWLKKKVLVTGHTGFKGSWLTLWLKLMGADVLGVSIDPPTKINHFELINIKKDIISKKCDIRNSRKLLEIFNHFKPQVVFHLAAQPLVIESYNSPLETYQTNVIGTLNVLESIRKTSNVRVGIMVTSDKCYENKEQSKGYKEDDPMGGYDPYSSSKGSCELLINSYRQSFFNNDQKRTIKISSARSGNVIGGGDFGKDRLLPDAIYSIINNKRLKIRNPNSIRPWQHVLEPLGGYINLAKKLYKKNSSLDQAWNFGPKKSDVKTVEDIVNLFSSKWGHDFKYILSKSKGPHEAALLSLDCSKAKQLMQWQPKWSIEKAIEETIEWYKAFLNKEDLYSLSKKQIIKYHYHRK
jgi:CDP-glucose 4,6-dehydratase